MELLSFLTNICGVAIFSEGLFVELVFSEGLFVESLSFLKDFYGVCTRQHVAVTQPCSGHAG